MKTTVLGHPRIGEKRELKKAIESYWKNKISEKDLLKIASTIKKKNWLNQKEIGIDIISSNDFSFYDQVLDMSLTFNCIPKRFKKLKDNVSFVDLYFAMARGVQKDNFDIVALEMTKWFDTNYHYLVPEFEKEQKFELNSCKIINEYREALDLGINTKPVLIGPLTYLLIGKEKENGFNRLDLLNRLLPVYAQLIKELENEGVTYIQFDEPYLSLDLTDKEQKSYLKAYTFLKEKFPNIKFILANYFGNLKDNLNLTLSLPVDVLHVDLVRGLDELDIILKHQKEEQILSLGIVNGRNIWKNNFNISTKIINKAKVTKGNNIWISSSCSLLHCPYDLTNEKKGSIPKEVIQWLAFSKQKLQEIVLLKKITQGNLQGSDIKEIEANKLAFINKEKSTLIHNHKVKNRVNSLTKPDSLRNNVFLERQKKQKEELQLPLFPTTTIGSFPQTKEVRSLRLKYKNKQLSEETYNSFLEKEITSAIKFQENIGLDVLVHGEFERNDMVEYFGERLAGFAFSNFGWVQSYGTRCVKPPILFGDVSRENPMTVKWTQYAQSLSKKHVKGMLTGPVTILQWSFVRDDQPRAQTCNQIALAIRDEVADLEKAGIKIIQIDEPAIREGLPLRKDNWTTYLSWAVNAFKISASVVKDTTQIHTHMCYSEFNDIIANISDMDADVITIETSRSEMELLDAFVDFKYPNEIGPGVYDIHSPRVPNINEIEHLLIKATKLLPEENIWVNPDCGLKTRDWPETILALKNMVTSAKLMRKKVLSTIQ
ncbi:5-methyltetrahydropteroyltriglutamate--homocysteine S-methyltransferase [Polaribacter sargassicola]|uniref:5-methyltetrahydropteroyltriglutamate-- homocysteine S-methyltransferase n=1 Tax=Polaribacter sargassicola TaxID=2836891 RepID=UPI001F00DB1F|nr:5-methyltetrahydropteroyltriglutamate--homocysteine S-methyltransferase [Polaribacter sp. DS7-9]MCG1035627.1 5-methyltetrahydropteroyltriglutamate--homocysteine S-methyltransferase [Polaribacter sp. DS7-9]